MGVAGGNAGCDLGALDELPRCIQRPQSYDMLNRQTWGSELLELCQEANLLILNGRTDEQYEGSVLVKSAVSSFLQVVACHSPHK